MVLFFGDHSKTVFLVECKKSISQEDIQKLNWLFGETQLIESEVINDYFVGPRSAMVTPWSTNAVEITQNMGIDSIIRMEMFVKVDSDFSDFDPMIMQKFDCLDQHIFSIPIQPETIQYIADISLYNQSEGLSLSQEEVEYLENVATRLDRKLTDSEVFGFSQVNSEHCRHKIFNGTFIIDGETKEASLFQLIKKTSKVHPNEIVSAYKDNVAFVVGPEVTQFAPNRGEVADFYTEKTFDSVLSLKAETHNFPTTVEPFNGAATGAGGEIRDRLAGGQGSLPLAGTAVYMTAYSRLDEGNNWEKAVEERKWLYQRPLDILIKASNGASDFGNKFGQPLIVGSVFTFEHKENQKILGFDKVIMLAGGIGYGKIDQAEKKLPVKGDKVILLGGDNYRIGMGGAAVSSADTGAFSSAIELNAIQRSNPEMQKRVANTIRAMVELDTNHIISIHDHGAGGHLNCLSELVEHTGGVIYLDALPVGDPTLSAKEIIGNESQERMGLVIAEKDIPLLKEIAERERSPMYIVGTITDDHRFSFVSEKSGEKPIDLALSDFFGSSPKFVMSDQKTENNFSELTYQKEKIYDYLKQVLLLESVACKDWLTNKVDRCVGGKVAKQQCVGPLQLPLNNCGVMALDFVNHRGVATSIGQAPLSALIDAKSGSVNAIAEALTNLIWAPLDKGIKSVSLSANWMWPCKNKGEDARLYEAVEACSEFAIGLGINIPTGKDSLSMKQKYPDGTEVIAPGTVIISAIGQCEDIRKVIEPMAITGNDKLYYLNLSQDKHVLGGTSFAQILSKVGKKTSKVQSATYFAKAFDVIQNLIKKDIIIAGHDIGNGGLITTLLEMCFPSKGLGMDLDLSQIGENDIIKLLFSENIGIVVQASDEIINEFDSNGIGYHCIGKVTDSETVKIVHFDSKYEFNVAEYRDIWFKTSYLLDQKQSGIQKATERFENYKNIPLQYSFPSSFLAKTYVRKPSKLKAAVIREKGSNSERELANALYIAGFEVKDIHMTDLISGRETLEDVQFIGAVGGFSNSDVLGSAKGWAGAFKYNTKANLALKNFFEREDTLSVGICNGCQLFIELGLINPDHDVKPKMEHNDSGKHESIFTSVEIAPNNSVMLGSLAGSKLGVWVSHGEGKFSFPKAEHNYNLVAKYGYDMYPSNPNGSDYNTAMMCSSDGRHLVMMPHIERSIFPWNWAFYPKERKDDVVSPWIQAFENARIWLEKFE